MANKVETTISYKLDARGLRDAKRELEKSFKPESVKALNAALKDARGRVKDLSLEYSRAAKAQGAMANMPKQLRANLKAARDEVQKLTGDLKHQLDIERKLAELHEKERQQQKADRATAFRQGALQGLGGPLSTFLQRREGATTEQQRAELWAQFKGQMVGGAIRRVGAGVMGAGRTGIGMASAMTGGAGPLSTLLGNVPFLGGAASLAEGAVGSYVDRQRAMLGALPYLASGGNFGAAGEAAYASTMKGGQAGLAAAGVAARARFLADRPGGGHGARMTAAAMQEATANVYGSRYGGKEGAEGAATFEAIRSGKIGAAQIPGLSMAERADIANEARSQIARKGRDELGNRAADRAAEVGRAEAEKELRRKAGGAQRAAVNAPFAGMQSAVHGLMTGTEAIQAGTQFTGQVGGRFNRSQFEQAFAAQTLYGVDQGTSAQLFRAQRAGRGGGTRDPINMLAKAIGAATAQGLEGSEVNEYLETIASAQNDAAQRGLKIDTETLTNMGVALSRGLGLEGPQAGRIAGNIAGLAQGVVTQGAKGPIDIQLLRAAGFSPEKGNFLESRRKLASIQEGGMDAGTMFDFMESLVGGEGDAMKRGYTLERSGLGLGTEQAITVGEMLKRGKGAFMQSFAGKGNLTAADLVAGLDSKNVRSVTGALRGQIGVQNTLVGAGGAAAGNVLALQQQAAQLASTMATSLKPFMDPIAKNIVTLSKGLEQLVRYVGEWGASGDGIPVRIMGR